MKISRNFQIRLLGLTVSCSVEASKLQMVKLYTKLSAIKSPGKVARYTELPRIQSDGVSLAGLDGEMIVDFDKDSLSNFITWVHKVTLLGNFKKDSAALADYLFRKYGIPKHGVFPGTIVDGWRFPSTHRVGDTIEVAMITAHDRGKIGYSEAIKKSRE